MTWCNLKWKTTKIYLGTNKEVFDAEVYLIGEALEIALKNGKVGREASRRQMELP